jgi:uncharacterized protein YcbX
MTITVGSLHIYPVKSLRGFAVDAAEMTPRGLQGDRLWMLVDAAGKFMTQRQHPLMATIAVEAEPGGLRFQCHGHEPVAVAESDLSPSPSPVRVWKDECPALAAPTAANEWFAAILGQPVQLVRMPDNHVRPADKTYARPGDQTSFADSDPLLVTSLSSLDALQPHFQTPVGMDRFRPNIVLHGADPFAEDTIGYLRIGEVKIELIKHCARCVLTTTDQVTGARPSPDPLRTLTRLRQGLQGEDIGSFFGQDAVPRSLGTIRVGDPVEILAPKPLGLTLREGRPFLTKNT